MKNTLPAGTAILTGCHGPCCASPARPCLKKNFSKTGVRARFSGNKKAAGFAAGGFCSSTGLLGAN
jgi:hypothetical protein